MTLGPSDRRRLGDPTATDLSLGRKRRSREEVLELVKELAGESEESSDKINLDLDSNLDFEERDDDSALTIE